MIIQATGVTGRIGYKLRLRNLNEALVQAEKWLSVKSCTVSAIPESGDSIHLVGLVNDWLHNQDPGRKTLAGIIKDYLLDTEIEGKK